MDMTEKFLSKAEENFRIAQMSFNMGCYNACANRAYYASFHAAIAALVNDGAARGENHHAWVQSEFNRRLIKRKKIYPSKLKTYLSDMQYVRNKADYSEKGVSKKAAHRQISHAEEMIQRIREELRK